MDIPLFFEINTHNFIVPPLISVSTHPLIHGSRAMAYALIISVIFIRRDILSRSASASLSKMNLMVS